MLIVFPLGLLATAVVFDVLQLITDRPGFAIAVGIVGGLLAALFGIVDWLAIPLRIRVKRVGTLHGVGNVPVVLLFAGSWLSRRSAHPGPMFRSGNRLLGGLHFRGAPA